MTEDVTFGMVWKTLMTQGPAGVRALYEPSPPTALSDERVVVLALVKLFEEDKMPAPIHETNVYAAWNTPLGKLTLWSGIDPSAKLGGHEIPHKPLISAHEAAKARREAKRIAGVAEEARKILEEAHKILRELP